MVDVDTIPGDVQAAVAVLRDALGPWTTKTLASLITIEYGGAVRGNIDVMVIGDVVMGVDRAVEELAVKIDAIQLLLAFISRDSG